MAIIKDRTGLEARQKIVGKRLSSARKMSRLRQEDAANAIGHKGITQISLAEDGKRMLPFWEIIKLCELYAVPLDWVAGRIDDPLADPMETNQGVILNAVTVSMKGCFETFTRAMSEHTAVAISGHRQDRMDLKELCALGAQCREQLKRIKELNPEFEEDWRGSAALDKSLRRMDLIAGLASKRIVAEESILSEIDKVMRTEEIGPNAQQFMLMFA